MGSAQNNSSGSRLARLPAQYPLGKIVGVRRATLYRAARRGTGGGLIPWLAASALIAAALAGCASPRPDLGRLYALQENAGGQPPVVIVHGLFGARLVDRDTGTELWPGRIDARRSFAELALEIDPQTLEPAPDRVKASGVADRAAEIALDELSELKG